MHTTTIPRGRGRPQGSGVGPWNVLGRDHYLHAFLARGTAPEDGTKNREGVPGAMVADRLLRDGASLRDLGLLGATRNGPARVITTHGTFSALHLQPSLTGAEARMAQWKAYVERKSKRAKGFFAPTDMIQLRKWLETSQAGQWCLYWEGYLPWDRYDEKKTYRSGQDGEFRAEDAASSLWRAYTEGRVELYQKRLGIGHYRYWAKRVNDLPIRERKR